MNEYIGQKCPFCGLEFNANDDVVVCSDCGLTHHSDCWRVNDGCTTLGCVGAPRRGNNAQASMPLNQPYYRGMEYEDTDSHVWENKVDEDVFKLIGRRESYYKPRFQDLIRRTKKNSWNWAAFWITPFWLMYRKMYAYGIAVLALNLVLFTFDLTFLSFLNIVCDIFVAIYANNIYMNFLEKKANKAKYLREPDRTIYIMKQKGVSILAVILAIVGYFVVTFSISYVKILLNQ